MSYVERDKVSLPEIKGRLGDHVIVTDEMQLHWLFPGKDLSSCLQLLIDDKVCCVMSDCITEGVANIYVEVPLPYVSDMAVAADGVHTPKQKRKKTSQPEYSEPYQTEDSDSDYQPNSDNSSADDEEAKELKLFAKIYKQKLKGKKVDMGNSTMVAALIETAQGNMVEDLEDGYDTLYFDSSEEYSYDEASDENNNYVVRRKSNWLRRSQCEWFQVITLVDEQNCPRRRDNKLVTANVIDERYGELIKANPTWKLQNIQQTVLREMKADVTLSKCKRAKSIVLQKVLDKTKDEYTKVFDYQAELLRSNPGSTIAVALNPEVIVKHVFQRFYVCFDACKMGFLAGCRRVVGLDGCFFKGACNGELLCAIGRDVNNQMYPIAWAVVEKEATLSWEWFIGLLIKDLGVSADGEGWVFISDQQKGLLGAISKYLRRVEHRMCARQIYANWKKKYIDQKLQKRF
ncbi:uncharacterized protein LOC133905320 [Phragmites australis]|uniref:uncharacterized protein LOC133905320 n=1 Tax=Phragmites australis TaxID=29695 RepID=UPI002D782299|nr:uncharacterized protein LOC133905320 [Phragmites australis]